jgi:rifampicin phosphotransferase
METAGSQGERSVSPGPEGLRWDPPLPGGWLRHFRWGEWLPEPVTPLFESWFLARSEARFWQEQADACGIRPPRPLHVLVNGWYFHSPVGPGGSGVMLRGLLSHPRFALAFMRHQTRPDLAERICAEPHRRYWEQSLLPRYRQLVAEGTDRVATAGPDDLVALWRRPGPTIWWPWWTRWPTCRAR